MHVINVHRQEIEGCWDITVDGKFKSASPSKQITGETLLSLVQELDEVVLIGVTDDGPHNRRLSQCKMALDASDKVLNARQQPEPFRP